MNLVALSSIGFTPETKVVLIRASSKVQETFSGKLLGEIKVGEPLPLPMNRKTVTSISLFTGDSILVSCHDVLYKLTVQTKI